MRSADSAGAPEARFAEQGSAQAPARDRRLYARDQMGAAILPRPREAGLGQIPVRQRQPLRFHAPRPVARRQDEGLAAILPPGELAARTRPVTAPLRHPDLQLIQHEWAKHGPCTRDPPAPFSDPSTRLSPRLPQQVMNALSDRQSRW